MALVPLDGSLSEFARSRLTTVQLYARIRLGGERFARWVQAGARSRST